MAKPIGLKLHRADGTVICPELISEGIDAEGMDVWRLAGVTYRQGDTITVETLPAMTALAFTAPGMSGAFIVE